MSEGIVDQLVKLEDIVAKYDGFVVEEAGRIRQELGVPSENVLRKQLGELDEEQRLLNIGIIGRVKAGKSSLLNAVLFDGKDILPKAATPMTASLTIITYGKQFAASVEYFTPEDIALIEKGHQDFADTRDRHIQKIKKEIEDKRKNPARQGRAQAESVPESDDKARRRAELKLRGHCCSAYFDHYERMKKSGRLDEMKNRSKAEERERITADDEDDLKNKLADYVGAEGALMPFTKSVTLELPIEPLRNIQVVDTPGINDPVKSREQRTQDYLKKCDVVLIVSPAWQFLSKEDTDLMDRITAREGVREMYIVAAQADSPLHGDVLKKSRGNLDRALEMTRSTLGNLAVDRLKDLKRDYPEVGNVFDPLINGGKERVMLTSAICHAMKQRLGERQAWDAGMNTAWENLARNYPDYFDSDASAAATLEKLANVSTVQNGLNAARKAKDNIIKSRRTDYLKGQAKTIQDYRLGLKKSVEEQITRVRETDIAQVLADKKANEELLETGSKVMDGTYEGLLERFRVELRNTVKTQANKLFNNTQREIQNTVEKTKEPRTGSRKGNGVFNSILNWISDDWGRERYIYTEEVTTVRTGAMKARVENLVKKLQDELTDAVDEAKLNWKEKVPDEIMDKLKIMGKLDMSVEDAEHFDFMLKEALRDRMNSMRLPDVEIKLFKSDKSGILKDDAARHFMDEVESYISNLEGQYREHANRSIEKIVCSAKGGEKKLSKIVFSDIRNRLEMLEKDIENKETTVRRLNKCLSELDTLGEA
ncbi:MAG: dynamin family protein [Azoarcus sp.]|jgi:tRNA U34 5-carboxymethylaminomethyl modifying GTPase MnmE/TrmE|nr:dynamin family protein [Azoarcus sp.]